MFLMSEVPLYWPSGTQRVGNRLEPDCFLFVVQTEDSQRGIPARSMFLYQ